jgi:hypothetical protein
MNKQMSDAWEFKHTDCDGKVVSVTFNGDTWFEALTVFEQFLRGCGFSVPEGEIKTPQNMQIVQDYEIIHPSITAADTDDYPPKPDGEGWISNKGNTSWKQPYHYHISSRTQLEVVKRSGGSSSGPAYCWNLDWKEVDKDPADIVWFRVVK